MLLRTDHCLIYANNGSIFSALFTMTLCMYLSLCLCHLSCLIFFHTQIPAVKFLYWLLHLTLSSCKHNWPVLWSSIALHWVCCCSSVHLSCGWEVKMWWNIPTCYKFKCPSLRLSSEPDLLKLSCMFDIKGVNEVCSSPKLSICWSCSISFSSLEVEQSLRKWTYSLHL